MSEEIDLPEKLQPPMANGELVFDEPWQGRLFGMAVALTEAGVIDWADIGDESARRKPIPIVFKNLNIELNA